ncbi:MAG TPA: hypothetical protein VFN89_01480 [Solirubrobacterales bacterium]|nr:hypothetical protein [Solirubrobacterales bacterium]
MQITAQINGRSVPRSEVLTWESNRARKVCKRLGLDVPADDLTAQREALVKRKLELGHGRLEEMLERQLRWSARAERVITGLSRGKRRLCSVELTGTGGSAEALPRFYHEAMENGDEQALLAACPDHYVLCADESGVPQVIETTGGSPLAARIFLDESDTSTLTTRADPDFPVQWIAVGGSTRTGRPAGGIRHQFRDEPMGFKIRLTGEFPLAMPPRLIRAHEWHLACEFSNWMEAANSVAC